MKNGRGIWIWAQNCPGIDPILKIIEIISRHHEYMRKAPRCTWKNFPGAPFWICRNLRLGYSSLILGKSPKAMTRRAPALRVNYSTKVYVTRQGGQQIDNLTSEFWTMWKFCTIADCQIDAPQIKKYNIWWLIKPRRLDCQDLTVKPWTKGRWWECDWLVELCLGE